VRTAEDIPDAIMKGLADWGFEGKENAFLWMLQGGKDGAQRWRERMKIGEQTQSESEATE
jgi:hypothetical protein